MQSDTRQPNKTKLRTNITVIGCPINNPDIQTANHYIEFNRSVSPLTILHHTQFCRIQDFYINFHFLLLKIGRQVIRNGK